MSEVVNILLVVLLIFIFMLIFTGGSEHVKYHRDNQFRHRHNQFRRHGERHNNSGRLY